MRWSCLTTASNIVAPSSLNFLASSNIFGVKSFLCQETHLDLVLLFYSFCVTPMNFGSFKCIQFKTKRKSICFNSFIFFEKFSGETQAKINPKRFLQSIFFVIFDNFSPLEEKCLQIYERRLKKVY